jgi:hypothetical protein
MPFERTLTEEQLNAIAVGRVQGMSLRGIAKAEGIPYTTVRDAAKRPEVAAIVASVQANLAADNERTTAAVREQKAREKSKRSSAKHRAKEAGFEPDVLPAERKGTSGRNTADGRLLGAVVFDSRTGNVIRKAGFGNASDDISEEEWRDMPREVIGRASVVLAACSFSYEPARADDVLRVARLIATEPEVEFVPLDDLCAALASVEPGREFTFEQTPA